MLEEMRANGYNLGGEQSGHVVLTDYATTGDGVLTALLVMARMASTGAGLAELADVMTPLPQVLINVPEVDKHAVDSSAAVAAAVAAETDNLAGRGRVLLRKSGTEPLVGDGRGADYRTGTVCGTARPSRSTGVVTR
jgi:phosphoglucosamine mutase